MPTSVSTFNELILFRYEKMKAVADGKRRNSSGKFVKKEVRLAEEAAAAAAAAANAAANAIEPAEEQTEQTEQPHQTSANDAVAENTAAEVAL
jgi:hypothetical protein